MKRVVWFFLLLILCGGEVKCDPIETPDFDERNIFAIKSPLGWGYRTFVGKNGLIGVLWPAGTSFNKTDTAVFVFVQNNNEPLPEEPDNVNLFREKCEKADFKFAPTDSSNDETQSIAENYFRGRCGRTMILMKEQVGDYTIIIAFVSARYVTKQQLDEVKEVIKSYKKEVQKYLDEHRVADLDDNDSSDSQQNVENSERINEAVDNDEPQPRRGDEK